MSAIDEDKPLGRFGDPRPVGGFHPGDARPLAGDKPRPNNQAAQSAIVITHRNLERADRVTTDLPNRARPNLIN